MLITLQQYFKMGGYAVYVWSAYGIASVILLGNLVVALYKRRAVFDKIQRIEK